MPLRSSFALLLALGACSSTRPETAYSPVYLAPDACTPGISCMVEASDDTDDDPRDELDGGSHEMDAAEVDPSDPLAALAGSYLMRVDYYSTATGSQANATLELKTRVSNLFFTTLTVVDGKLHAVEQLCAQTSNHRCLTGETCDGWQTQYDVALPAKFLEAHSKLERDWELDASGHLAVRAGDTLLTLGYDPGTDRHELPTDADATVWQLEGDAQRRGVHTYVTANLLKGTLKLECHIGSVMQFATAFGGELDDRGLPGLVAPVDVTGSDVKPVYASGNPGFVCNKEQLLKANGGNEKAFVRFKKAGSISACPTPQRFVSAFPLDPAVELDAPEL
jgi:hypothetical protein